jgi:hypothetical protein
MPGTPPGAFAMSPSLIQPVLSRNQLRDCNARYIIGVGEMGRYARSQLASGARDLVTFVSNSGARTFDGRPVIDIRAFCASAPAGEPVIYATRDTSTLTALIAANQAHVIDIRELFASEFHISDRAQGAPARLAVVSTVPRSGTYRLRYFFYALNEILNERISNPSPHKLFAYQSSNWEDPHSRYHLSNVYKFLDIDDLRIGHHVPPGALARLSAHPTVERLFRAKAQRFSSACARYPSLAVTSCTMRPLQLEPNLSINRNYHVKYAFVVRDIIEQITSMLSIYELVIPGLMRMGAEHWSVEQYIHHCHGYFRPFALFLLDGQMPLVLQKAIGDHKPFVDVVLESGHLSSLIFDYALQTYSAEYFQTHAAPGIEVRTFHYEKMLEDSSLFLLELMSFLRGTPLTDSERFRVSQAGRITDKKDLRKMENELGHSLSYSERLARMLSSDSHMTDIADSCGDFQRARELVASRIRNREGFVRTKLAEVVADLRAITSVRASGQ